MEKQKKSSGLKWLFIIITIGLLFFASLIIAGIFGILFGVGSSSSEGLEADNEYGNVALIRINGIIATEAGTDIFGNSQDTSSSAVVERLEIIKKDDTIKAVIFEINSPGGSGVAADEIASAIRNLNKTTVSYVREIGASAAYWIAASTDHIIANRLSFVGSIGVVGSYLDFSGLLKEYNVTYQRFVGGKYKDFGSPYVQPSEEAKEFFQEEVDIVYEIFISDVAKFRNMSIEEVRELAHGMVYTGVQGLELGLIDEIGGKKEAVAYIENDLNITADIIEYKKKVSLWSLLTSSQSKKYYSVGRGIGDSIIKSEGELKIVI